MVNAEKRNLERIMGLKEGIKRLTRLLQAENANLQYIMKNKALNTDGQVVSTRLGSFLSNGAAFHSKPASYEEFAKGVWVAIDECNGANWIVVEFVPADHGMAQNDELCLRAPRFSIHPVITSVQPPKWVTLETELDKTSIAADATLKVDVIANFYFLEPRQAMYINTAKIVIRCFKRGGNYDDITLGHFPVTTVPMAHTLINPNVKIGADILAHCTKMVLIIFLPKLGHYTFNLYGFSLEA